MRKKTVVLCTINILIRRKNYEIQFGKQFCFPWKWYYIQLCYNKMYIKCAIVARVCLVTSVWLTLGLSSSPLLWLQIGDETGVQVMEPLDCGGFILYASADMFQQSPSSPLCSLDPQVEFGQESVDQCLCLLLSGSHYDFHVFLPGHDFNSRLFLASFYCELYFWPAFCGGHLGL